MTMNLAKKLLFFVFPALLLVLVAFDIWGFFSLGTIVPSPMAVRDSSANRVVWPM